MRTPNDILNIALAALVVRLREQGRFEDMCTVAVMPGNAVTLDVDCGGVAWVRLSQAFDSTSFPVPSSTPDDCYTTLVMTLEMGIMRADSAMVEAFGSELTMPSSEDLGAAAAEQLADMMDMREVIKGLRSEFEQVLIGSYTPAGPEGGATGGSWEFTVGEDI